MTSSLIFIRNLKQKGHKGQAISFTDKCSPPEVFLGKGVLKICSKFTGEHPYQSAISINLLCYTWHGCSPVICCIFSKHLFLRTLLQGCFYVEDNIYPDFLGIFNLLTNIQTVTPHLLRHSGFRHNCKVIFVNFFQTFKFLMRIKLPAKSTKTLQVFHQLRWKLQTISRHLNCHFSVFTYEILQNFQFQLKKRQGQYQCASIILHMEPLLDRDF